MKTFEEVWEAYENETWDEVPLKSFGKRMFNAAIESMQPEKEWPQEGDEYWCITHSGDIKRLDWENYQADEYRMLASNCFKTAQKAKQSKEQVLLKGKILARLKELNDGVMFDWGDRTQWKWHIFFNRYMSKVAIDCTRELQYSIYAAKSQEVWQQILSEFGEEKTARALGVIK